MKHKYLVVKEQKFLEIGTVIVNPVGDGPAVLDQPIRKLDISRASIPLDQRVKEMLCKALEDLV